MKRSLWTATLTERRCPPWPCPTCSKGTLALVPKSLTYKETVESKRAQHDEGWTPDEVTYAFTAWAKCNHQFCGQEVVVSGVGGAETVHYLDSEGEPDFDISDYFVPRFCFPMPDIFEIPKKCPKEIKRELCAAFTLFWSDPAATANRVRIALERLMDHLDIPKRRKDNTGKFSELTLHQRIEQFEKGEPAIGGQIMALKWLGNTGSHEGIVGREDLLDAFEILEHALAELIDRRTAKVAALAKKLMKKHAPRHKR